MSTPEVAVDVESFAAVYVASPTRCPPGKQLYKDHRGYHYRLDLQSLDTGDAATVVEKAREQFDVELVRQVREGDAVTKERRYVSDVSEVPDGYIPERGPQGGIYYETNPTNDPTDQVAAPSDPSEDVGYAGQPVLAVHFEDVAEDDRVAFENPETGERDIGRVTMVDADEQLVRVESGHGHEWVRPETFELTKSEGGGDGGSDGGTLTTGTEAAHNPVHGGEELPEECRSCGSADRQEGRLVCAECEERLYKDCDGHHVGPGVEEGHDLAADDVLCEAVDEVFDRALVDRGRCPGCGEAVATADLAKEDGEDVWVYYVGPQGGEGWQNVRTGEIRYQKGRPGPAPEGGDGYGDWLDDGWSEPPDDLGELMEGQTVEVYDEGREEYHEAQVEAVGDGNVKVRSDDIPGQTVDIGDLGTQLTAVEEYDRFDPWFDDSALVDEFGSADAVKEWYFEDFLRDEPPADAPDAARALDYDGTTYPVELPLVDEPVELPFMAYADSSAVPDGHEHKWGDGPVVSYEALEDATSPEMVREQLGPPEEVGATLTLPNDSIEEMLVDFEGGDESAGPPDDWTEVTDAKPPLSEGDPVWYQSDSMDAPIESEVKLVDEQGDVLTDHDHYLWPEVDHFEVYAPEEAVAADETDPEPEEEEPAAGSAEAEADEPDFAFEPADPETFNERIAAFIEDNPGKGAYLTEHDAEELADHDLYMTTDGGAGAAVSPEGDIQNVFNHTAPSGAGKAALEHAIEQGGRTLDCYDGHLPGMYKDFGFVETARQEFVADYAPEALEYDPEDPPDVVFMHYDPEADDGVTDTYIDDWDEAKQLSRDRAEWSTGGAGGVNDGGGAGDTSPDQGETAEGLGVDSGEQDPHPASGGADGGAAGVESGSVPADESAEGAVGEVVEPDASGLYDDADLGAFSPDDVVETYGMDKVNATTGNTVQAKQVVELADGTEAVYTNTDHHKGDPDLGMRAVASAQFARELFDDYTEHGVPEIDGDPYEGYFFSAAAPGEDVVQAPSEYKAALDPEDFYRQAGIQVLLGNNDAHVNNVKLDEDGQLHWFDMDHAGGSIHDPSAHNKNFEYDDGWDRIFGELARTGTALDLGTEDEVRAGIFEAAVAVAEDIDDAALSEAREYASEYHSEFAGNITENITALKNGNHPYEPY